MPELHDYQRVAVAHLDGRDTVDGRAGLFMEMGLGKTAVTLRALTPDRLPALVTAPKRVTEHVWRPERDIWRPDLDVRLAVGSPAQRAAVLRSGADVVVIGRDNLADAVDVAGTFETFVLDELSGFKTRGSNRWKAAAKIRRKVARTWGLTGTPSPNGLLDLWAQVYLLDGGQRLGKTLTEYRTRYFRAGRQLPSGTVIEWILRDGAEAKIHRLLEDLCLSMEAAGRLDLPDTVYNVVEVPLPPNVRAHYRRLKDTLVADLRLIGGDVHTAQNAAVLTSKLSQLTAGFLYPDDPEGVTDLIHTEKVKAVREIVDGTGSPVLVAYRFRQEAEMLQREFPEALTLDAPDVVTRWNAGAVPVLLLHPQSAGHGLNLQKGPGHTIVWTTLPWSLEEWEQTNARLARQGQTAPVMVHLLMSPKTVDPAIRDRLLLKASVQDALMAHLESPL